MSTTACPSEITLTTLVGGSLAEEQRGGAVAHLATCARCRTIVSESISRSMPALTMPSATPELPGTGSTIAGRYVLGPMLGRGGMGVVYEAVQLDLGRPVAIKLLPASADSVASARFAREARTLGQLVHPNIVQIFDYGSDVGTAFVVMERLQGVTLAAALRADGPFAIGHAIAVASEMLLALSVAHDAGVVHRDVKPANVFLVTMAGVAPQVPTAAGVKLLDFGIASINDGSPRLTATGMTVGTPAYMAPEQVLAGTTDHRADIYAVGVCLFEMLTRRRPFQGGSATNVVVQIVQGGAPRADSIRPDVPAQLADVIERAMARDPSLRFPHAAAMLDALAPWRASAVQGAAPVVPGPAPPAPAPYGSGTPPSSVTFQQTQGMTAPVGYSQAPPVASFARPSQKKPWLAMVLAMIGVLLLGVVGIGGFVLAKTTGDHGESRGDGPSKADASAPASASPPVPGNAGDAGRVVVVRVGSAPGAGDGGAGGGAAAGTSSNCECQNSAGGLLCTVAPMPNCSCNVPSGGFLCPKPFDVSSEHCLVRGPGDTLPYSAVGRKRGESCSGFTTNGTPGTGVISCQFCYGHEHLTRVAGAQCKGLSIQSTSADDIREGKFVCH